VPCSGAPIKDQSSFLATDEELGVEDPRSKYFVKSLARGLSVLAAFHPGRQGLSLADIAEVAGVTTPSALRISYTLTELGYLIRDPSSRTYNLGPRALSLGMATLSSMPLVDIAEPHLRSLRDRVGETVKLAILDGTEMVYTARLPSRLHPESGIYVGSRLPAHATSGGRAILSQLPTEVVREILSRSQLTQLTPKTVTSIEELLIELKICRERGYAISDQSVSLERRSIAAALMSARGEPVAAISISTSAQRVSLAELQRTFASELVQTGTEISSMLPAELEGTSSTVASRRTA
jgi:IclR family pca regulon transcriptional regulator